MSLDQGPQFRFEPQLRLEAERVLADESFRRAPIQSKLLKYLVERTVAGPSPPTQYEIAVDGLGKDSEYDIENDSYPRVQISRLKRNLQNYYARNQPADGLAIELHDGSYRLHLVPRQNKNQSEKPHGESSSDIEQKFETEIRAHQRTSIYLFVAIGLLGIVGLASWMSEGEGAPVEMGLPRTALILDFDPRFGEAEIPAEVGQSAQQIGKLQLRNSFVSSPLMPGQDAADADYLVDFHFGQEDGSAALFLTLYSAEGTVLYAHTIVPANERTPDFEAELEASLVYMTSPTGRIARNELEAVEEPTASDYHCFLSIENNRSRDRTITELVNQCISLFPESKFAAYWHARRSFANFQSSIANGETIETSGLAGNELRRALALDPTNAFANFVAAKLELSAGRCDRARVFIDRALERGASYPALVAAAEAEGTACSLSPDEKINSARQLRALARFTPDPDPLLHLYLVLGLLALDERAAAEELSGRLTLEKPVSQVEIGSDMISRAIADREFARRNREELRSRISLFVWSPQATDMILGRITE